MLGGTRADIVHDVKKGFVTFEAGVSPAVAPAADAAEGVTGAADKELGVCGPTGSCESSKSSSDDDNNAKKSKSAASQTHSFSSGGSDSRETLEGNTLRIAGLDQKAQIILLFSWHRHSYDESDESESDGDGNDGASNDFDTRPPSLCATTLQKEPSSGVSVKPPFNTVAHS